MVGVTFRAIGTRLGISVARAHELQEIALKHTLRETTADYVTLQEQRAELLMLRAISAETEAQTGREKAALITAALRATDQLNRMRGIYDRTEVEAQDNASSLLDTLVENSRRAAAAAEKSTTPAPEILPEPESGKEPTT